MTSKPGHHQTAIQTLPKTVGLATEQVIVLDALRKVRNVADYAGDLVPESAVSECIDSAQQLLAHIKAWLKVNRPELI